MNKYLVLYRSQAALSGLSVSEMFAQTTPEQMAAGMAAWQNWQKTFGNTIIDLGAPLDNSTTVLQGTATPDKSSITGYSFLEAQSMQEAVTAIQAHPHFHMPGASVQILQCISMPGM